MCVAFPRCASESVILCGAADTPPRGHILLPTRLAMAPLGVLAQLGKSLPAVLVLAAVLLVPWQHRVAAGHRLER